MKREPCDCVGCEARSGAPWAWPGDEAKPCVRDGETYRDRVEDFRSDALEALSDTGHERYLRAVRRAERILATLPDPPA